MVYDDLQLDEDCRGRYSCAFGDSISADSASSISSFPCSQGHRSSLNLRTLEGGSICLVCFSNLITSPQSPTVHVSYALAQLSIAVSHRPFLEKLVRFHSHLLVSPLVQALVEIDDEKISDQIVDFVCEICRSSEGSSVCGDFVARISDMFSSGCLAWSKRQAHMLHCFGVLLTILGNNPYVHIKDTDVFLSYLFEGLHMPSEDIRGEIMFVLYRLVIYHYASIDRDLSDDFYGHCPEILHVSLDTLMKTQSDDVRLNCIALLAVLAQRGAFEDSFDSDASRLSTRVPDSLAKTVEGTQHLNSLFAEAVKGPLLSSDSQVQIGTLELIYHHLLWKSKSTRRIQELVEENIADYVFEVLRLSAKNDVIIDLCLKVLDILAKADQVFSQRLPIGFSTLVPVLNQVAEVPFHPVQSHALKLILICVSDCPGIISIHHIEELGILLTKLHERHIDGEMVMLPETFNLACSLFVALISIPSSAGVTKFAISLKRATEHAVSACLSSCEHPTQLLFSLHLLKEAYGYSQMGISGSPEFVELRSCILDLCKTHLLPWVMEKVHDLESEEIIMGILETFHAILLLSSGNEKKLFAENLVSSPWFSFSFECLGLYPTESMRLRVFMLFGALVDVLLGGSSGQLIKDVASQLPSDPIELLVILRQRAGSNLQLICCQNAALLIFYVSSLYNERLADEKLVLDSLEQYILGNSCDLPCRAASLVIMQLVNIYALHRGLAKMAYQIPCSPEAESILFQIICESDWDFLTAAIHPSALKWLFQQDKISEPLSLQILKFCRNSCSYDVLEDSYRNDIVELLAELVEDGDNYVAMLFVCILNQLLLSEGCQLDIISVMHIMWTIINICPRASNYFCLHGIGNAIQNLYSHASHPSFIPLALQLVFNILSCVQPEELSDDDVWVTMTVKLVENMSAILTSNSCSHESAIMVGILSLILNHSANGLFKESAKIILLSTSWVPASKKLIDATCSTNRTFEGSEMNDGSAETLLLLLLLQHFSQKSLPVVLPGYLNWQHFLDSTGKRQFLISCHCNDLCRLLYFGSPLVKLAASNCLTQLFASISKDMRDGCSLNCGIESVMAVFEGLIFSTNIQVAMNCALCLTNVLQWTNMDVNKTTKMNKWRRFITEELVMSMAAPCLASNSFTENCKAAARVSVAVLRMDSVPQWMKTVFDEACISGIVANLSPSNISTETVILFQELLKSGYLNPGHIASIEKVLQACRKHLYSMSNENNELRNRPKILTASTDDAHNVCDFLIHLMLSGSSPNHASKSQQNVCSTLIEAIDTFFMRVAEQNDAHG